jgi:hypothetical protein
MGGCPYSFLDPRGRKSDKQQMREFLQKKLNGRRK